MRAEKYMARPAAMIHYCRCQKAFAPAHTSLNHPPSKLTQKIFYKLAPAAPEILGGGTNGLKKAEAARGM
jgi:hypothetical protein